MPQQKTGGNQKRQFQLLPLFLEPGSGSRNLKETEKAAAEAPSRQKEAASLMRLVWRRYGEARIKDPVLSSVFTSPPKSPQLETKQLWSQP